VAIGIGKFSKIEYRHLRTIPYLYWRGSPEKLLDGFVDAFGHVVIVVDQVEAVQPVQA
jgi:hypothetical protein